jgi:hypothetical protein
MTKELLKRPVKLFDKYFWFIKNDIGTLRLDNDAKMSRFLTVVEKIFSQ